MGALRGMVRQMGQQVVQAPAGMANPRAPIVAPTQPMGSSKILPPAQRGAYNPALTARMTGMKPSMQPIQPGMEQTPQMPGPVYPATPMQVPIQSQAIQPTATSQPQTQQGPAFLKQFGEGGDGSLTMNASNPRAQFDAAMYRRGGTPWSFGSQVAYAPQTTQQMAQNFAQGTMQPQAMPQLSDAQMQALAQMIARSLRF